MAAVNRGAWLVPLLRLAGMASAGEIRKINTGVAGWDYRDWKGILYPGVFD